MSTPVTFNFQAYSGLNPLTIEGLRSHVIDPGSNREYLLVTEASTLPEKIPRPLTEILLGKIGVAEFSGENVEVYALPNDYLSLGSVLNDAASSSSTRAKNFARGVFREIGHSFKRVHDSSSLVASGLSYLDIIIERDVANFRILPPVEFVQVDDESALMQIGRILQDELFENAGSEGRKQAVIDALDGYWSSIRE